MEVYYRQLCSLNSLKSSNVKFIINYVGKIYWIYRDIHNMYFLLTLIKLVTEFNKLKLCYYYNYI